MLDQTSAFKTFMPNGLCARCDVAIPVIWDDFKDVAGEDDEPFTLGFCSRNCLNAFCAGIKYVNLAL